MKILVTGGAGFIGSALVRHLIAATTHDVLVVDKLTYAGNLKSLSSVERHARYHFSQTDICDHKAIEFVPDRPGHDFRYATDFTKITGELGWTPHHSFEAGLAATVTWYVENRAWWEPFLFSRDEK